MPRRIVAPALWALRTYRRSALLISATAAVGLAALLPVTSLVPPPGVDASVARPPVTSPPRPPRALLPLRPPAGTPDAHGPAQRRRPPAPAAHRSGGRAHRGPPGDPPNAQTTAIEC